MKNKRKPNELLQGCPELYITKLVRRSHKAEHCPHKGNCLQEVEMIEVLSLFLEKIIAKAHEQGKQEILKELLRELPEKSDISIKTNKPKFGNWVSGYKRGNNDQLETIKTLFKNKLK